MTRHTVGLIIGMASFATAAVLTHYVLAADPSPLPGEVRVTLDGGHDIADNDPGRPVNLIAAALGVPDEVFREAFGHVRPARGRGPTGEEAQKNKYELMSRLGKHGVTNERLDEVSNFYRYRPQDGGLWTHKDAVVFAVVKDGRVTAYRVAEPGYGYSSPPAVRVDGMPDAGGVVTLRFDRELTKNGSIAAVRPGLPATRPSADDNGRPRPPRPNGTPPPPGRPGAAPNAPPR